MKVRKPFWVAVAAAAAMLIPLRPAHAGFKYSSTIVEDDASDRTTDIHLKGCMFAAKKTDPKVLTPLKCASSNSVTIVPSTKPGDGGSKITLNMKNVTCNGLTSLCNRSNNVLELWSRALGTDTPSPSNATIVSAAGVVYNLVNGQALFAAGGKNTVAGGPAFGPLVSSIFTHSLGIGLIKLHDTASDPAACAFPPLVDAVGAFNKNHNGKGCIDGEVYAVAGLPVPVDVNNLCHSNTDCPSTTQYCLGLDSAPTVTICQTGKCTDDTACPKSGTCNINAGTCCDEAAGVSCTAP